MPLQHQNMNVRQDKKGKIDIRLKCSNILAQTRSSEIIYNLMITFKYFLSGECRDCSSNMNTNCNTMFLFYV